jgi:hypothetical protein
MNHGWIGVIAGMLLAGPAHAQSAAVDPVTPSGEPPVAATEVPGTVEPGPAAPWPTPAVPAYGTPSQGAFPPPGQVIRIANPPPQRLPALRRPPTDGQIIDMPPEGSSWFERLRAGRRRVESPVSVPTMAPQMAPMAGSPPQMLPEIPGNNVILMEKSAQDQLPPAPGEVPSSSGSPTEPLQQLPQPRPLDMAEPAIQEFDVPPGQWWFGVDFLLWFMDKPRLPIPLLTTTSSAGTNTTSTGALSGATTQILFGTEDLRFGNYPGGRFSIGYWFAPERILGLEASIFNVEASDVLAVVSGSNTSSGVLSRPFTNAASGVQQAAVVAFPVTQTGTVSILATSQLAGGEFNLAAKFIRGVESDWDLIAGLRFLKLEESLDINQNTVAGAGNNLRFGGVAVTNGSTVTVFDRFETRNRFSGVQFGVRKESHLCHMILGCQFKVAAGVTRQTINIDGGSSLTAPGTGATTSLPGGILALPTNIGEVVVNEWTLIPQLQITVGYQCMEHLRLWASYECLMWSNTARPGDQIDPSLNVTQVPTSASFATFTGPVRPVVPLEQESLFLQGLSFGMELKY